MSKIKLALDVVSDLKSLAGSIETMVHAMEANEPAVEINEAAREAAKEANESAVETNEPETAPKKKSKATMTTKMKPKETPEAKPITLEEIRAVMADKSRDGHREAVKAIITKYGVNNLSSLDPKHYTAALNEVGELK